jgi:hemerythrin-like domain-containing protein
MGIGFMTIIDGLVAEHRVFLTLFDQIERVLPAVKTVSEIALVCRLLEAPLHDHGGAETDLAYIALDHILHQKSRLTRLYHDHQEVDGLLKRVRETKDLPKARTQLKATLDACRAHFRVEEQIVFPLIEKALQRETLLVLGKVWKSQSHLAKQS